MAKAKIKNESISIENKIKQEESDFLKEPRNKKALDYISEPSVTFKVGDKVCFVSSLDPLPSTVLSTALNGKIVTIEHCFEKDTYGKKSIQKNIVSFWWMELMHFDEFKKSLKNSILRDNESLVSFSSRQVEDLILNSYKGIDFNPDYQRDLVWTQSDKELLIESLLNNVDIGKFVLLRRPYDTDGKLYECVDGKQRLNTLIEFFENKFTYKGKTFRQLHPQDRHHIATSTVAVAFPEKLTKNQVLKLFIKINTTGKSQDSSHLDKVKKMIKAN